MISGMVGGWDNLISSQMLAFVLGIVVGGKVRKAQGDGKSDRHHKNTPEEKKD